MNSTSPKLVTVREVDGTPHQVPASEMAFRNSIYGVVIKDDHVLLCPQWDGYDFPGGGIDLGETMHEALVREVFEETGLTIKPDLSRVLYVGEDMFMHPVRKTCNHCLLLYYLCTDPTGEISDANFDESEKEYAKMAEWIPLEKVRELKFYNAVNSIAVIESALGRSI